MASTRTRIDSEIDLSKDGKQFGFLRIPHSVHRSAYGWLPMPIACIKNGNGPNVLLLGGNHGDEYEGQVALTKLAQSLEPAQMRGRIIILPMANYPAAQAGRRTSPIDGGNLNRTFPGDADGTPTEMIAHLIEEVLAPECDLLIDIHSGGSSLVYIPSLIADLNSDGTLSPKLREYAKAFGAPITLVQLPATADRMSSGAALRKGADYLTTELAGMGTVTPEALRIGEQGLARVLYAAGCFLEQTQPPAPPTRFLELKGDEHYVYGTEVGLFEPLVELGDEVVKGKPAAAIHFPETPWREAVTEIFKGDGVVVCKRVPGRVERGDCLFHLGADWAG